MYWYLNGVDSRIVKITDMTVDLLGIIILFSLSVLMRSEYFDENGFSKNISHDYYMISFHFIICIICASFILQNILHY